MMSILDDESDRGYPCRHKSNYTIHAFWFIISCKRFQDILVTHRLTEAIVSINSESIIHSTTHAILECKYCRLSLVFKHDDDLDRQMTSICPSFTATTRLSELNMLHKLSCQVFLVWKLLTGFIHRSPDNTKDYPVRHCGLSSDSFLMLWLLGMCPRGYICQSVQYAKFVSLYFAVLQSTFYMMFQNHDSLHTTIFYIKLLVLLRSPKGIYSDIIHSCHFLKENCRGTSD